MRRPWRPVRVRFPLTCVVVAIIACMSVTTKQDVIGVKKVQFAGANAPWHMLPLYWVMEVRSDKAQEI